MIRQQKFLTSLIKKLESEDGCNEVLKNIELVRQKITSPENMVVHLATNVDKLQMKFPDLLKPWEELLPTDKVSVRRE